MKTLPKNLYAITLRKAHSFMLAEGFNTADLLHDTELNEAQLSDPYAVVTSDQARAYYMNVVRLADRPGLGLEIGWSTSMSDLGSHGLAQIADKTVSSLLASAWRLRDNYNLLTDWSYEVAGREIIHTLYADEPDQALRVFLLERSLGTLQAHAEEILGPEAMPLRVRLAYPRPASIESYEDIFRCQLRFSQSSTQLIYSADWLHHELEHYDPQALEVLGALRESLHEKLSAGRDIVADVRMALRRKPGVYPSLEQVATELAMSSRNLRRKLGQKNMRFQTLLDQERERIAEDLLLNTEMSIQRIAERCGFADAQNFSQAFKRWRGKSPSAYRQAKG